MLACPVDKGPLLWFDDEDVLYNPRLRRRYARRDGIPVMLVDEATDGRRGRARAAGGQGGSRRRPRDRAAAGTDRRSAEDGARWAAALPVDSVGMWEVTAGLPEQMAAAVDAGRWRSTCCEPIGRDQRGRARHGRQRHRRRRAGGRWPPRSMAVPVTVVKSYELPAFVGPGHPGVRGVVLGRHRGDGRPAASRPARRAPPW